MRKICFTHSHSEPSLFSHAFSCMSSVYRFCLLWEWIKIFYAYSKLTIPFFFSKWTWCNMVVSSLYFKSGFVNNIYNRWCLASVSNCSISFICNVSEWLQHDTFTSTKRKKNSIFFFRITQKTLTYSFFVWPKSNKKCYIAKNF